MSEATDITLAEAREIVLQIAKKKGWISQRARENSDPETLEALESVREELGDAVETIARDIYSRKARFVLELIQNAEDNQFTRAEALKNDPSITFEVRPTKVIVECNEDGFTEANVISICRTGQSSKKYKRGYIGEKGIGFKSVFQVASKVHVQSNSFSFSFQYGEGINTNKLGIVTPILEDELIRLSDRPLTRMTLTLIQSLPYDDLVAQFEDIPDNLLLFLSTIKMLKIKIHHPDQRTTITTFHKLEDSAAGTTNLIKTVEDLDNPERKVVTENRYFITTKSMSQLPDDKARLDINECEVVLAFPVDSASSPLISTQDVFAFLPIRNVGFSFLIQADFILQASRQDVVDSARNKAILTGVAEAFRDAVLEFHGSESPLRYQWMRFLPSTQALDKFWVTLSSDIIDLLNEEAILYPYGSLEPLLPNSVRTLPSSHLDDFGLPLFLDRPGVNRKYLSMRYDPRDIEILRMAFHLQDIADGEMFYRIKQDLDSRNSKIKGLDTDDNWHSRAADLISSVLLRSPDIAKLIRGLCLIPLTDGQWVNASAQELYFPSETGPEIPRDLVITIDPKAIRNNSRKKMLERLGVTRCSPKKVIELLWTSYLKNGGASNMSCSRAHISYLYWNYGETDDARFSRLWLYDRDEKKVTSRQKLMYLQSEDEYGPQMLLQAEQHPTDVRRSVPECSVPFINSDYMNLFPSSTRRHDLSWTSWLERALGVRRIPRLKFDGGSLSTEFRHIIRYRPEKVVATLKAHWDIYKNEMGPAIVDTLSQSDVACLGRMPRVLNKTYLPLQGLKDNVLSLGILQDFPFLKLPDVLEERQLLRDWRFLDEFGVGFDVNLNFYVEILRQHEARRHRPWDSGVRDNILKTYESIADLCSDNEKVWLWDQLDTQELILDPCAFQPTASGPSWTDIENCVWHGPVNLLDKKPLASVPQYRDNPTLIRFFRQILGVEDANWNDYLKMLLELRRGSGTSRDITDKILRLYQLLSEVAVSNEDWAEISESFEVEGLIYMPSISEWFSPSDCLWTSPVMIDGKAIISNSYPDELKRFFLERLRISPASLRTLVEELHSLSQRNPSVSNIKQMIWAINAMNPKQGDLDTLLTSDILPVRVPELDSDYEIFLRSSEADFVVIDRTKLADIFDGQVAFLNFDLEEVQQLEPFLQSLGLIEKYLSSICDEETTCDEIGLVDSKLTAEFKDRAYDLLRCAVSYRSPIATNNPRSLYDRLLATSIRKTDRISTRYNLRLASGFRSTEVPRGYLHTRDAENTWQILVPQNRRDKELCYSWQLPEALAKLFQITPSAREIISNVLNRPLFIIDDILEAAGIGKVRDIQPPPRSSLEEEAEEQELIITDEAAASSRNSRAQSAPLPTSRNRQNQIDSPRFSNAENRDSSSSPIDTDISQLSSISLPGIQASPSIISTPEIHGFRDSSPLHSRESARRRLSPENVDQNNYFSNDPYREFLDNIIRIANRTSLPHCFSVARPGNIQFQQGFDHAAVFGVRSQGQMSHDTRIGAAGELFIFEILSDLSLPQFGRHNWKSTIRKEVIIHPKYSDMEHWSGIETADITYKDINGRFTSLLIQEGYLEERVWRGACPKYFIEVKSTTGECDDRFFLSNSQYLRMQAMALTPGQTAPELYIIFRVFNLSRNNLSVKIYVDPEAYRQRGDLIFESQTWTVRPRIW